RGDAVPADACRAVDVAARVVQHLGHGGAGQATGSVGLRAGSGVGAVAGAPRPVVVEVVQPLGAAGAISDQEVDAVGAVAADLPVGVEAASLDVGQHAARPSAPVRAGAHGDPPTAGGVLAPE